MGTSVFGPKYIKDPIYGYFSLDYSQDEEVILRIWVA